MTSKIILKKSVVENRVPVVSDLEYGELALNYKDGRLYYKRSDGVSSSNDSVDYFVSGSLQDTNTTYTLDGSGTTNSVNLELIAGGSGSGTDTINLVGSGVTSLSWDENSQRITVSSVGGTFTEKTTFPSAVASRPQLPGGFLGLDTGDGNFDIWGISRDYYPSHPTAGDAWGVLWNGASNEIRFIGAGNTRLSVDLDGEADGLKWNNNTVLHAGNYNSYRGTQLTSPNGTTVVAADNALPDSGHSFIHTLALGPGGNDGHILGMTWANTASVYGAQLFIDTDPTNTMAFRSRSSVGTWTNWNTVLHSNNYTSYSPSLTGTGASGTWGINITGNAATASNSSTLGGLTKAQLFNNMGNNHNTYTDFNNIPDFGTYYVQAGTNSPTGVGAHQWYGFTLGLGNDYSLSSYGTQLYWPRAAQNSDTYLWVRDREGGSWGSWRKILAGYADTAGSATDSTKLPLSGGTMTGTIVGVSGTTLGFDGGSSAADSYNYVFAAGNDSGNKLVAFVNGSARSNDGGTNSVTIRNDGGALNLGNSSYSVNLIGTGVYAPILYDSNDTSYYVDPASTSTSLNLAGYAYIGKGIVSGQYLTLNHDQLWAQGTLHFQYSSAGNIDMNYGGGYTFSRTSLRAPVFYDSNDTSYYVDPNSTSRLYGLTVVNSFDTTSNDVYANMRVIRSGGSDGMYIGYSNNNSGITRIFGGGSSGGALEKYSDYSYEPGSFRAPIFYDSNNTAYYADPASTSVFNQLTVDGDPVVTKTQSGSDFPNGTLVQTDIDSSGWAGDSFRLEATGKSYGAGVPFMFLAEGYLYSDTIINYNGIHLGHPGFSTMKIFNNNGTLAFWWPRVSYWNSFEVRVIAVNGSGGNQNRVTSITDSAEPSGATVTKKITVSMAYYMRGDSSAINADTIRATNFRASNAYYLGENNYYFNNTNNGWFSNVKVQSESDMRAPIFYDYNNTAYYLDPSSTSTSLNIAGGLVTPLMWVNYSTSNYNNFNEGIRLYSADNGAAVITFNSTGTTGSSYGSILGYTDRLEKRWAGQWQERMYNGYTESYGSFRAPIFYDSNDTNYYVDPASTSRLNTVSASRFKNIYDTSTNHTFGLFFGSDESSAYAIYREAGAWDWPYPDLRIAFHTGIKIGANASYQGVKFYTDYDMATQVMSVNNGSDPLGAGNVFVNYSLQADSSLRAPIFYDSNDTSYYGDFNSLSRMSAIAVENRVHIAESRFLYMGGTATNENSWGSRDWTNGGNRYYNARSHTFNNDGYGSTYSVVINGSGQLTASVDVRAPIFYDSNDTSYYCDPNATSNLNNLTLGGRNMRAFESNSYIEFYVEGDANTYYPVRFDVYAWFHFARWSISRGYGDTAPWDPIGTGAHKGGLTLTWEWSGDGAWGGNDKTIRVIQFAEQYTTMVGGMALSVNGLIVWLRGGNAYYRFHGPGGMMNGVTPYYSTYTAANGSTFSPRSYDSGTVASEVTSRMPVRSTSELYDGGNRVLHLGNYTSYTMARDSWNGNLYFNNDGRIFSTILYDSNDSGYYIDPNSTSRQYQINFNNLYYAPDTSYGFIGSSIYVDTINSGYAGDQLEFNYVRGTWAGISHDSLRAPLYYDYNDTSYYVDPASTSYMNALQSNRYSVGNANPYDEVSSSPWYGLGQSNAAGPWGPNMVQLGGYYGIRHRTAHGVFDIGAPGWGTSWIYSDYNLAVGGQARATVYYDYSDTGYYVDPNGTSNLVGLTVANTITGSITGTAGGETLATVTGRGASTSTSVILSGQGNQFGGHFYFLPYDAAGNHYPHFNDGGNGTGAIVNWRLFTGGTNTHTHAWTTSYTYFANRVEAAGDMRTPIFYDSNNTAYYWDGASTSKWNESNQDGWHTFNNYGLGVTGTYDSYRLQTVFAMGSAYRMAADGASTSNMYGLAWSHPNAGSLGGANNLNDHGLLIINNGSFRAAISSRAVFSADVRGTLFYDYNNTGYYCDPNGTSRLGNTETDQSYTYGWFRNYSNNTGLYNQNTTQHLSSTTNGYWDMSSTTTVTGIRFYTGGHLSALRGYVYADTSNNIGFLNQDGSWRLRVVSGDYSLADGSSMRAQVFYDSNDTNYYVDPASTSILNSVRVASLGVGTAASGTAGEIRATNNITAYYSDDRLKTNLGNITNALEKVMSLNGFYYEANEIAQGLGYKVKREVGLSAQQVEKVLPEIVVPAPIDEKYKTIHYDRIIPLLVEAIKEQQSEIDELKSLVKQLLAK